MRLVVGGLIVLLCGVSVVAQVGVPVRVEVRSDEGPVAGAAVTVAGREAGTDASGTATLALPPGPAQVTVVKDGFLPATVDITVGDRELQVIVELTAPPEVAEEVVVVATTRTGRRLDDQPTRVEVLGREEIEEKMLMTPGDIVMMLNEMGGLRVQATSPSIGAASVRVQGMKGRYTRFLSDGLPLYGQQVGGLGLLQIPPMDLGQVEVIKGTASALYGAGAMGGVVNLLSRRPGRAAATDALVNLSSLGGADGVGFVAGPLGEHWSASLLASGHHQSRNDRDDDAWADVAGYHARGRASAAVLGRRQRPIGVRDRRRVARGPRGRHDVGRGARGHRAAVHRGARHPSLRRRRHRADAAAESLRADGAGGGRVAAPRPSVR